MARRSTRAVRARRRSARVERPRLRAAGIFTLAIVAFGVALTLPQLTVRDVRVLGATRLDPAAVRAASGLLGRNVFLASDFDAAAGVAALAGVRAAHVTIGLPDRAVIAVEERVPLLVVASPAGRAFADADGVLFPLGGAAAADVPTLEDEVAPGDRLDPALVAAARQVAALQPGFFGRRVEHIRLQRAYGLVLALERGTDVRIGSADRLDLKLDAARAIALPRASRRLDYVDVRTVETPVYFPSD